MLSSLSGTGALVFAHLHCHSHYSFLRGVASPEEIASAAVVDEMLEETLTDTNGLYAAVLFYKAAQAAGIKPLVGVVLDVAWPQDQREIPRLRTPTGSGPSARNDSSESMSLVLLAADMEGYSNLCQLVTLRHLGTTKLAQNTAGKEDGRPVALPELAEHSRGVIALCPMPARLLDTSNRRGTIYRAPTKTTQPEADAQGQNSSGTSHQSRVTSHFSHLKEIFADRLYIEVQILSPGDRRTLREAEHLGQELGVPLVATNNVHFLRPEEHLHHRAVNAIRTGGLLTTVAAPEITTGEAWFKSFAEMQRLFPDHPQLLQATTEIADRCNLQLELGKTIFPEFNVPEGESAFSYLWKLSFEGARKRYKPLRPAVLSRLTHELEVIEKLHLAPYFLLVWDIVEEARRR